MKKMILAGIAVALLALAGCAPTIEQSQATAPPPDPLEKLIWSSAPQRPAWTMEEPATRDGVLWFVGLSGRYATEQGARDDARRNAMGNVVSYMGTLVKKKFEEAVISYGLSSDVVDPTESSRAYEKQLAVNMANNVKMQSWYQEKWHSPTGTYNLVFVLAQVPQQALDETYKQTAQNLAKDAERKAKEAGDAVAKDQAEKAADFWKKMQEQGVYEQ